jgi:hypothetical protein
MVATLRGLRNFSNSKYYFFTVNNDQSEVSNARRRAFEVIQKGGIGKLSLGEGAGLTFQIKFERG